MRAGLSPYDNPSALESNSSEAFNPRASEADIPLSSQHTYQQWDKHGRAVGYAGDPHLYAPHPQRATTKPFAGQYNRSDSEESFTVRGSTDTVGWEPPREPIPPRFASPQNVGELPPQDPFSSMVNVATAPPQATRYALTDPPRKIISPPPSSNVPSMLPYAAGNSGDYSGARLPPPLSPPPSSGRLQAPPQSGGSQYGHGIEPTDSSYVTAHSQAGSEDTQRTFSPPPPTYRTDLSSSLR
jgi:hypothetical protein